ncbi:MAG: 30S ribosomal protein S4 [Elusimicrobia bacterium CG1_02_63_36]|nr:MAG: 30S ribosomal protein S4 [Elusimicrobia bacterium CG1_02_63_36]PIP85031.1 MAG: 30S ribosomal protein S4 [Elusimicrobia bacterium CG22_combo_CG10-13_8_21_14_all_63_91]PJA12506.1 MAG: 30S ribosomal protein S4 [Elusimicrobia bacterium CG_4_10_14_0_2_um_filter_63_34]PJB25262.1 MAG: 30S ribosomal protein S4 [Elusimicrobia bacterium CG_4_9_14_3_um_filter_62_55]
MARYTGAVCRLCRREQTKLFLKGEKCYTKCVLDNRPTPPGAAKPQRGKPSEFKIRLREKQKLRRMIGMTERPFARVMANASKAPGNAAVVLLQTLETRLDNVIRRAGLATSLSTARQMVQHGHVKVNGETLNIPSYKVRVGETVSLSGKLKGNVNVNLAQEFCEKKAPRPSYLEYDAHKLSVKLLREPSRDETAFSVNDQLIVEYYSR